RAPGYAPSPGCRTAREARGTRRDNDPPGACTRPASARRPRVGRRGREAAPSADELRSPCGAVDLVERFAEGHSRADEDRRLPLGVRGGFGVAQIRDERDEATHVRDLEGDHELLVVDAEAVSGV